MLPQDVQEGLRPIGARLAKVEAIPVTTSSVIIDLQARTNIWNASTDSASQGRLLMLQTSADVYYAFNSENSGSIDQTNTTPGNATQCDMIPAGARVPIRVPYTSQAQVNANASGITNLGMCRYLLVRGDIASTLRISLASEASSKKNAS